MYERLIIVDYLRKLDIVTSGVVIAALRFRHLTMISTARTASSASSAFSLPWIVLKRIIPTRNWFPLA